MLELLPRFTFDTFVVGTGNRLAVAAARRVAESPGTSYNPLFIYSASGLGKTHLITSIGHHALRVQPELRLLYDTLEHFMTGVLEAIEAGRREEFARRLEELDLLLLDDVQFLAGRQRSQEELLRIWDALSAKGDQVVVTSDRPPQEIDGLDDRLLSRFSGGLIVDIGAPDYETRLAILRRTAEEHAQRLPGGVAELLARTTFSNVRELQGALNRILAVQELEGREVSEEEVVALLGHGRPIGNSTEFHDFMAEVSSAVGAVISRPEEERQLADAILRWEGEEYRTRRLEAALATPPPASEIEALIRAYETDVERLREISGEIAALDPSAPELARRDLLRDPDRIDEASLLLAAVRERRRPLDEPPAEETFDQLDLPPDDFALRAGRAVAAEPGSRYNPFLLHGGTEEGRRRLLASIGNAIAAAHPGLTLSYVRGGAFAAELIQVLSRNLVDAWRKRYGQARVLLVEEVDALADTERAQEELFHLVDGLLREGAQVAVTASRRPRDLHGLEERLRSRLESGLVVELAGAARPGATPAGSASGRGPDGSLDPVGTSDTAPGDVEEWVLRRDKVPWVWPYHGDWVLDELD